MSAMPKPHEHESDLFYRGTGLWANEILLSMADLATKVRDLAEGNNAGSAVQQKLAAEETAKIAGHIKSMADAIARVTVGHIARRPRA